MQCAHLQAVLAQVVRLVRVLRLVVWHTHEADEERHNDGQVAAKAMPNLVQCEEAHVSVAASTTHAAGRRHDVVPGD